MQIKIPEIKFKEEEKQKKREIYIFIIPTEYVVY